MPNEGYILPWGRNLIPEIEEMPVKGEACPICDLMFTDMTHRDVFNEHIQRCMAKKIEDRKNMIALGYKLTSKGWVMRND